jgi:uroporphyrinogen decarboxylase
VPIPDTPRKRILDSLSHRQPQGVPVDIGGSNVTTMVDTTYEGLKRLLNVDTPTEYFNRRARQVVVGEEVLQRLGSCARPLMLRAPDKSGFERDDGTIVDEWGVGWRSAGGHYNPMESPLAGASDSDLAGYAWPDPDDPGRYRGLAEDAARLREEGRYAAVLSLPVAVVHLSQYLRSYDGYLIDLVADPSFAERLMGHVMEIYLRIAENALRAVGSNVDVVTFGDDLAFQDRPMVNPDIYRRLIKPHHATIIDLIKRETGAAVMYHCCGAVRDLIPDFIEIGVDALNPVQVSAVGMGDTAALRRDFGADLTFWGGIDTQHVLPHGSPADVRREVRRRIDDLANDGGYILAAVHDIQEDVSPENVLAMVDAAVEFGGASV